MRKRTPPLRLWLPTLLIIFAAVSFYKLKYILTNIQFSAVVTLIGFLVFSIVVLIYSNSQSGRFKQQIFEGKLAKLKQYDNKEDLYKMNDNQFEHFVADFFEVSRRFKTYVTEVKNGDGGKDIIMWDKSGEEDETIYVEVKLWKANVGRPILQKLVGAMTADKVKRGYFVTSSKFTRHAISEAAKVGITLIDGDELVKQIQYLQTSQETLLEDIEPII